MRQVLLDVIGTAGFALIIFGAYQIYQPLAWILGGLLVAASTAALSARK